VVGSREENFETCEWVKVSYRKGGDKSSTGDGIRKVISSIFPLSPVDNLSRKTVLD